MSSLYVLYDNPELNLRARRPAPLLPLIRRVLAEVRRFRRARATANQLHRMPDYLLRDLGIERGQIDSVARSMSAR